MTTLDGGIIDFSPDRPINEPDEDKLNRSTFAEAIARAIAAWRDKDSLVISLTGPWGAGKSSVKNLIKHYLSKEGPRTAPVVVEFVPWQVSGEEKLTALFFDELSRAVGRIDHSKRTKTLVKKIRRYQARFKIGLFVLNTLPLKSILWVLSGITACLGLSFWLTQLVDLVWVLAAEAVAAVLLLLGAVDKWFAKLLEHLEFKEKHEDLTLAEVKAEIGKLLADSPRPVLMIIDDIDRLMDEEIGLIFRIIKSNADFPNTVYLLLFDQLYVEDALGCLLPKPNNPTNSIVRAPEYLKKIVQVQFEVPDADVTQFERGVLFKGLDDLFEKSGAEKRFDSHRWQMLYPDGLRPLFRTVRDVNRFLSSLGFYISAFRGEFAFNVNPVDLVGLEALRVFEPRVYEAVRERKVYLVKTTKRLFQDEEKEQAKNELSFILGSSSPQNRRPVEVVLQNLFPYVATLTRGYAFGGGYAEQWYRESRICHEDIFDRYFSIDITTESLTESEIQQVLQIVSQEGALKEQFDRYLAEGRIKLLLAAFENHKDTLPVENVKALLSVLMWLGDQLPPEREGFFGYDSSMTISRVALYSLRRVQSPEDKLQALLSAIEQTEGTFIPVAIADQLEGLEKEGWGDLGPIFDLKGIGKITSAVAAKLDGFVGKAPINLKRSGYIVRRWSKWGGAKIGDWVSLAISDDASLLDFLSGFMGATSHSGRSDLGWTLDPEYLANYVALALMDEKVKALKQLVTSERDRLICSVYELARTRQEKGLKAGSMDDNGLIWSPITVL